MVATLLHLKGNIFLQICRLLEVIKLNYFGSQFVRFLVSITKLILTDESHDTWHESANELDFKIGWLLIIDGMIAPHIRCTCDYHIPYQCHWSNGYTRYILHNNVH